MSKNLRLTIGLLCGLFGAALIAAYFIKQPQSEINPAQLQTILQGKAIERATLTPTTYAGIYTMEGTLKGAGAHRFAITTHLDEGQIKALLSQPAITIDVPDQGFKQGFLRLLPTLIIGGLVCGILIFHFGAGKSKKRHRVLRRPKTRFTDIAGIEEAMGEVQEVVEFLRQPRKYTNLGGKLPRGILLVGPPGTGKTMLARAIAGEANASFFSAHGSDFNEVFIGVGAKRVRDLFRQAASHKPAIIFIDEIDCLGKGRKQDSHGEWQQTTNALLAEMDGFNSGEGVVVVGATNRAEDLDEALLRPGRFDRKVHVPLPDRTGRRAILKAHTTDKPIAEREKSLDWIAQTTCEMSGADLANLVNEAAILCASRNHLEISLSELEECRDKVRWGKERKSFVLRKQEREMVAYHEAGHTMVNLRKSLLPPLYKVSIIPRGGALGTTTLLPEEDKNLHSKGYLLQHLALLMGGRAAETVFYGATTNGAQGDLESAKKLARRMVLDWGMGQKLYYQTDQPEAEQEINRLLEDADHEALALIEQEKEPTRLLAETLLRDETLTREQVLALLAKPAPASAGLN
ncbi:MAG TPA: AAA family ATPase [Candidatus Saccharimonadales bacterium]|nr:AAA family ATPase [Candidatus Saccharimonadales bacterium]